MLDPGRKYNEFSLPIPDDNAPKIHDLISKGKETLKNLKVYVPTEEYNSAMTFEQNLAEGRIKLMSELPVSDINTKNDPIQECMTSSKMHQDFSNYIHNNNQNQEISDFDALVNPNLQSNQIKMEQSSSTNSLDPDNLSDTSQDGEKQHVCDVCDQKFSRRRDLALHYLTHSEKEKKRVTAKCDTCKKILKQCKCKKATRKRATATASANSLIEPHCISLPKPLNANTVFIKAESVTGQSDVIKRELFHCTECTQVFGLLSQMKQHLLSHKRERARKEKEEKALTCNFCNKKCISKSELLYHKSTVHPNNTNVVSNQIYPLDSENISYNLQPQVCSSCRTVFNDMTGLQKHFKRLGWVCGICSTYFCLKSDFGAHCLTHLDSIPYDDKNCCSSVATESSLAKTTGSSGKNIFLCNKCPKKFKFFWMLNQHKLKHTLRKNKFCFRCSRSFKLKNNACIHFFSHGTRNRYECGECNKTFYEEKCLQAHLFKIH